MTKTIDILTSALNEEVCLPELYSRIKNVMVKHPDYKWRMLICDNGSTDSTWEIISGLAAQDNGVIGMRMSRTFSLDAALTLGMDKAEADAVILMASDLQDPPEVISDLIMKFEQGYEQVVVKILKRETVPFLYRHLSALFYSFANKMTKDMIPRNVSDFRLLSRPAYKAARLLRERNRFLRGLIAWTGFKTAVVEIERPPRFGGESKFLSIKIGKVVQWAFSAVLSHTSAPLIWVSIIGVLASITSFFVTVILAIYWISSGVPFAGFGSIVGLISLGFSLVLLCVGVLAQYIALIYEEVKARPLYIIAESTKDL